MEVTEVRNKTGISGALFGAYIFAYMTSNTLENLWFVSGSNEVQLAMYLIQQASVLAGLLFYGLFSGRILILWNKLFKTLLAACFGAGLIVMFLIRDPMVFYILEPLCAFVIGITGGTVYEYLALSFKGDAEKLVKLSSAVGFGGAAAIVMQWLLQFVLSLGIILPLICAASLFCIFYFEESSSYRMHTFQDKEYKTEIVTRSGICLIITVCAVLIMLVLYEVHMNNLEFATYFLDWPRLFTVAGYLTIAFAGRTGRKDALSLVMLCMALLSVLFPILLQNGGEFHLHMSIFYVILGTAVSYYTIMFAGIAPYSRFPAFTSSLGRILDGIITVVFGVLSLTKKVSMLQAAVIEVVLFALSIVMLKMGGYLAGGTNAEMFATEDDNAGDANALTDPGSVEDKDKSLEEIISEYAVDHGFTPRETDVYKCLVTTDLKNQEIADSLYISRRALQNHIKSIYEKAGVANRAGLIVAVRKNTPEE